MEGVSLSIVVPVYNEAENIAPLVERVQSALADWPGSVEIIFVDDGSTDATWKLLTDLQARLPELAPVKNEGLPGFGRAVICGLDHMKGDVVVIRYEGPRGGPGMREMLTPTSLLSGM